MKMVKRVKLHNLLDMLIFRSSHSVVFWKICVLRNFAKFTGKHLCQKCFPVNFAKILRTPFFTEHLQWLLLELALDMLNHLDISLGSLWQLHLDKTMVRRQLLVPEAHTNYKDTAIIWREVSVQALSINVWQG